MKNKSVRFIRLLLFAVACHATVCATTFCYGNDLDTTEYLKASALLFPETASWTSVKTMKTADLRYLQQHREELKKAYLASGIGKELESKDCSLIERVFSEGSGLHKGFYVHDVDRNDNPDIIYTGSSQCAEGDSTIVWFGSREGYTVRQEVVWPMLALRVKEGNPVRISSVAVGCCASVINEYFSGTLENLRRPGGQRITKSTLLPSIKHEGPSTFVAKADLTLRSSPKMYDQYDEAQSDLQYAAVFGNVLSKFMAGCSGTIIGRYVDQQGKLWGFVSIDTRCNPLRIHAPFNVTVGWIEGVGIGMTR